jgi:dolichol-phosphate mannosyltransferase
MSGFFAVRLDAVEVEQLRPMGFKIFLEILLRGKGLRVTEVGFVFAPRFDGESKAGARQGLVFLAHILRLRMATLVPRGRARRSGGPEPMAETGADIATFDVAL